MRSGALLPMGKCSVGEHEDGRLGVKSTLDAELETRGSLLDGTN